MPTATSGHLRFRGNNIVSSELGVLDERKEEDEDDDQVRIYAAPSGND